MFHEVWCLFDFRFCCSDDVGKKWPMVRVTVHHWWAVKTGGPATNHSTPKVKNEDKGVITCFLVSYLSLLLQSSWSPAHEITLLQNGLGLPTTINQSRQSPDRQAHRPPQSREFLNWPLSPGDCRLWWVNIWNESAQCLRVVHSLRFRRGATHFFLEQFWLW